MKRQLFTIVEIARNTSYRSDDATSCRNCIAKNMSIKEVLDEYPVLRFSRMPVYSESIDEIQGVVIRSELLVAPVVTNGIEH